MNQEELLLQFLSAIKDAQTSSGVLLHLYGDARWFEVKDMLEIVRGVASNIVDFQIMKALSDAG